MYKTLNNVRTTEKNKARVNEIENRLTGLIEMLRSNPTSDEKKKKKKKIKILPIFLKFLLRHTSYFRRKAFYEDEYDKLNEPFSNIKPTFFPY